MKNIAKQYYKLTKRKKASEAYKSKVNFLDIEEKELKTKLHDANELL